jgi:hypothetical protein
MNMKDYQTVHLDTSKGTTCSKKGLFNITLRQKCTGTACSKK